MTTLSNYWNQFKSWLPATKHDLNEMEKRIMALLDTLQTAVERDTSVVNSAIVLIKGLAQQIKDAGTDPVKLKALTDQMASNADALAAAVVENTPAESGNIGNAPSNPTGAPGANIG